jgi:hypothetical protein
MPGDAFAIPTLPQDLSQETNATISAAADSVTPTVVAAAIAVVHHQPLDPLDKKLIWIVSGVLCLLAALMVVCLALQWQKYDTAIGVALGYPIPLYKAASPAAIAAAAIAAAANGSDVPDHAAALTYAQALDEAIIKTSALMLAFVVVFLGALYVLRTSTAQYHLSVTGKETSGTLETSSPGLVMVTLGLVIVAVAVLHRTDISYQAPSQGPPTTDVAPADVALPTPTSTSPTQPGVAQQGLTLEKGGGH